MDVKGETLVTSSGASPVHSNHPTPEVSPSEHHSCSSDSQDHLRPRHDRTTSDPDTIIPNRIFVGAFDHRVSESDLRDIFSEYGTVTNVNIVNNRSRLTKRYGFVTFEDPEDASKLIFDVNGVYYRDKRLCIRPAYRKQHDSGNYQRPMFCMEPMPMHSETVYLTTSGFPYTFHNGVAYFHSPRASPNPHLWTPQSAPVTVPQSWQPVYHQPAYHHYQPRYVPNHYHWNNAESAFGSGPVMYAQPEYLHHVPNGVSGPQPLMDDSNAEHFDPVMHQNCPMYPLSAERVHHFVPHGKNHMYSSFTVPPLPPAVAYSYIRNQSDQGNEGPQTGLLQ